MLKKRKFYTLSDIKNQIVYTPLVFVIVLAILSSAILYFFLKYQQINETKLLIQSENFHNKNILKGYIRDIKFKTGSNFDEIESKLKNHVFELNGYFKHIDSLETKSTIALKEYLKNKETKKGLSYVIFDTKKYNILHGKDIIEYLRTQTNSKIKTRKFREYMLRNIESFGDKSILYWIDNERRDIRLSLFMHLKEKNLMIGAFTKSDDLKRLTKKAILSTLKVISDKDKKSHFVFYDINEKIVYNYRNKNESTLVKDISRFDLLDDESIVYSFPKYNYKIITKSDYLTKKLKEIKTKYEYKLVLGVLIIILAALFFSAAANIFGRFINTIFNRYNKRLERKNSLLKKWKDRYELAIIASNDGLWDINLKTNRIFFSKKWLKMFGYERDDIQNFKEWLTVVHSDDRQKVLKKFQEHIEGKSDHFISEYRLKDKQGNYKWVLVRGKAFIDDNSSRMLMMSMDIDDRMKLTKELRDVELLTEYGKIVVFRWRNNENLDVKFVSNSIEYYGYEAKDFQTSKMRYFDFIYEDDVENLKKVINKAIKNDEKSFTKIHRVVDSNKKVKWVYNRTILVKDDYGKVTSLYGYINDITKIKMNEEELKQKVKEEVEKNIKKDRLLIQQNKMASMGEMLGNIAHQWRQPLNNINLLIHFIRDNFKNFTKEELDESVNSAKLQINYMSQTIDDFRNFYQPTKDKKLFSIKDSISQCYKIVASSFEQNSVEFEIVGDDTKINSYENEFEQVIVNILNNAVDAAKVKKREVDFNPKVLIDIRVEDSIIVNISNNCGTIPSKVLDRIFEPYFTTKFENQGTGIGLYMAKVIVEKNMQGRIEAANKADGVEFTIKL